MTSNPKKIALPLKMNHTFIKIKSGDSLFLAKGYDGQGRLMPYITDSLMGAGSIKSSISDMLQYVKWNLAEQDKAAILSHSITLKINNSYAVGLNWQIHTTEQFSTFWQQGYIEGFISYCVLYPGLNMGIVILTNEASQKSSGLLSNIINNIAPLLDKRAQAIF